MGGGGGGRGLSAGDYDRLQQKARQLMSQASGSAELSKCNAFISFANEDLNAVNLLRGQAKNDASGIEFNDWSLKKPFDSKDAEYIRRGIRERIRQCSVTIIYVSEHTAKSKWVDWEIRESTAQGKGVLAVYQGDTPPAVLPPAATEFKIRVVRWDWKELPKAIRQAAK